MKDSFFGLDEAGLHDESVELLTTVHDGVELMVLRSILEGEKIPYMTKDRGSGSAVRRSFSFRWNLRRSWRSPTRSVSFTEGNC